MDVNNRNVEEYKKNKCELEQVVELDSLVTPCYVFDIETLYNQIEKIRKIIGEVYKICFAIKANPYLVPYISDRVDRLEVCSPGEYNICMKHKVDASKIVVSGVNKTYESMMTIMEYSHGAGIYTIESVKQLELLEKVAKDTNTKLDIIVRLSSGNQFGVDETTMEYIVKAIISSEWLEIKGIHYYSGTQKKLKKIEKELVYLDEYIANIKEKYNLDFVELEYGPSLMTKYFENESIIGEIEQLKQLKNILDEVTSTKLITLEFGRFIATRCGDYITKVNDVKVNDGRGYVIVDGGIHQVNYYGQMMGMKKPYISLICGIESKGINSICEMDLLTDNVEKKEDTSYTICGSLCTVNDVLVREASFSKISKEDKLVFHNVGAYSLSEGMALFLTRELPQVYVRDVYGKLEVLRSMIQVADIV